MTSEHTKGPTQEFFRSNDYFGLKEENLIVFEQGMLPCFTFDGKIILESTSRIAKAPGLIWITLSNVIAIILILSLE